LTNGNKATANLFEGISLQALIIMAPVVVIIAGIVSVVNVILNSNFDSSVKYSLSMLFIFFLFIVFMEIRCRLLMKQEREKYESPTENA
jgi:hypothetical protein